MSGMWVLIVIAVVLVILLLWFRARSRSGAASQVQPAGTVRRVPRRGPPSGYQSPYLSGEKSEQLLVAGADGMPPLWLVRRDGALWLAERSTGLLVNVGNRQLRKLGIWSVRVRGDQHYRAKPRLGPVTLVREPENPHDRNAVAIHVESGKVGYFNKQMAASLAKELDAGTALEAEMISVNPPKVIAAAPRIMAHLHGCRS
ncbi:MAG: hypothetical protein D3X82_16720 [Candidatus Leucobacter sulfamidivorax]|nr:hypothetical protein [Candidatus Leucobacter sulfamidivorax]